MTQGKRQITVLVLRDEASGQLDYRQSALRLVLQPGTDYEAFIRERRHAQRVFVNPLYADIAVDAALIAFEYTALAADSQVVQVRFIPDEDHQSLALIADVEKFVAMLAQRLAMTLFHLHFRP